MTITTLPVFSLKLFKQFCPSTTTPGGTVPNPSDNWLPVADTVVTLPTAPPIVTAPETIPGNSAPVDGCFDPDNVDYSQIFNNLLPQEDVEGVYDESLDTDVLIQGKNEIIPIRGVARLVFGLITSKYDLTPKFTDVVLRTRSIIAIYKLKAAVDAEEASYSLGGRVIGLTRQRPPLLANKGAYTLLGYSAILVGPSQRIFSVKAGVFSVNPLKQVLLLSHFDSDFDEQTGNTVGYNWWYTEKPEIIATSKFGGGALSCDSITYNSRYLFTYLNPAVVTQDIPTWTIEAWVYLNNDGTNTIPVGFTADGHPDGMSFYLYAYKYSTVSGSEASVSFWYENNSVRVAILDSYVPTSTTSGWHHIALSFTGAAYRVYFDGAILSDTQSGLTDLPFQYPSDGVTSPVNVKSGIAMGSVPIYAGQQAFFYVRTYVDEVRLIEGLVTETGTFPVPTEPYTTEPLGILSVNLHKIVNMVADATSFTLTGQAISFTSPSKVLKAEFASFALTGQNIALYKASTVMLAGVGSYTVLGKNTAPIPTLVGSVQGSAGTSDLSVTWPTGYAAGDVGIMITESSSQNAAARPITPPYGWSLLDGWPQDDTNSYCSVFYKVTEGSESSVVLPRTADHQIVILSVFRYVDPVNPIITAEGSVTTLSNSTIVYPAVTGAIPSTLLVEFRTNHQDTSTVETDTGRSNTHPAWSDGGLIRAFNTSLGDGGGVTVYQASTRWILSSGLPGTTATSTRGFGLRTLGTLVLRPKDWYGDIGP